ncbi:MAG: ABC transporter permease, partial [Tannerellaceae bacterium]
NRIEATDTTIKSRSHCPLNYQILGPILREMQTPECISFFDSSVKKSFVTSVGRSKRMNAFVKNTDADFFNVFDFDLLHGFFYSADAIKADNSIAIVTDIVARELFNRDDVVDEFIKIDSRDFRIVGVVRGVSNVTDLAYGDIFTPIVSSYIVPNALSDFRGKSTAVILARSKSDFPEIKKEFQECINQYNKSGSIAQFSFMGQPDDITTYGQRLGSDGIPDLFSFYFKQTIIFIILLLVPAINLSAMSQSRLRRRLSEIGVRRAFGSTKSEIIWQVLFENFILTLISSVIGLLLSFATIYLYGGSYMSKTISSIWTGIQNYNIAITDILKPEIFAWAFFFCLLMNLLSNGIMAYQAGRLPIVKALNGK